MNPLMMDWLRKQQGQNRAIPAFQQMPQQQGVPSPMMPETNQSMTPSWVNPSQSFMPQMMGANLGEGMGPEFLERPPKKPSIFDNPGEDLGKRFGPAGVTLTGTPKRYF